MPELEAHRAAAADPEAPARVPFKLELEGKRAVAAKYPIVVEVMATDGEGREAKASTEAERR